MVEGLVEIVRHVAVFLDADALPVFVHPLETVALESLKREEGLTVGDAFVVTVELAPSRIEAWKSRCSSPADLYRSAGDVFGCEFMKL